MIQFHKVSKSFKRTLMGSKQVKAIQSLDLKIEEGKITGILGSSGSGKTTLARLLLRTILPDEGKIYYKEADITKFNKKEVKRYRQEVQIIFQNPESSLVPTLTVLDNLLVPIKVHGLCKSHEESMAKIKKMIKEVGVPEALLHRYPHQISGGEAQRIVICRALLLDPKVIILDEPTSMLDVSVQAHIMNVLKAIQKKFQLTYILISHDLELVSLLSDQVVVMKDGEIVEQGITQEVMQDPKHIYTQTLIDAFKIGEA